MYMYFIIHLYTEERSKYQKSTDQIRNDKCMYSMQTRCEMLQKYQNYFDKKISLHQLRFPRGNPLGK